MPSSPSSRQLVHLGPFQLIEPIGKGGMGEIWSACHRTQGIEAAVKLLTRRHQDNREFTQAFSREVSAVAGLDHPNIVVVFDHGEVSEGAASLSDGQLRAQTPYLAMELVCGGSLADKRGQLDWSALKGALLDLLSALAHAHSRGVIHRDIKPGNVLLGKDGTIKLTDFGLAHATDVGGHRAKEAHRGGTPAYMAPEQLQAEWRDYGPWTDLYAVGCLAWAMSTGKPPFHQGNRLDIMQAHVTTTPPAFIPLQPVPSRFEAWLRHLLAKNPQQRFLRAADAAWALLALGEPTEAVTKPGGAASLPADQEPCTTLFWSDGELAQAMSQLVVTPSPVEPRLQFERPPIPQTPHRSESRLTSTLLNGAGLGLYGLRSLPIVGRSSAQERLWNALAEVHRTETQTLVHIDGPIGCGKSCLAEWLCQRAHEVGAATILKATHAPFEGPGHGLIPMVANHLRCVGLDRTETAKRVRIALLGHGVKDNYEWQALTELLSPSEEDTEIRLGSLLQRHILMQRMLARLGRERPVILWIEDVHWGDDALGLIQHLLNLSISLPVLVLMTSRQGVRATSPERMKSLAERPETIRIDVAPLSTSDTKDLVRRLLGLDGALAERVEERVCGNPLFAVQLVGDWVNRGLLEPAETGYQLKPGAEVHLPDDLHALWWDALQPMLSHHHDDAIVTLELAATLGEHVDQEEWSAACVRAAAPDPSTLTDELSRARLMRPEARGWVFTHAMLRESLERTARESDRWASHNHHCCDVIRSLHSPHLFAHAGRLGRHLVESGAAAQAIDFLFVSAHRCGETSDYRAGLDLLERRDDAADRLQLSPNDERRIRGWLLRSKLYLLQGRPQPAQIWASRASETIDANQSPTLKAEAYCRLGQIAHKLGELDLAERRLLAALPLVRATKHWDIVGECLFGLGGIADSRGRYARAQELFEDASEAHGREDNALAVAECIDGRSQAARQMGNLALAAKLSEDTLNRFQALGNLSGVARSQMRLARVALLQRDYVRSGQLTQEALRLFEHTGNLAGQQRCLNGLAESARFQGHLGEAEQGYRDALKIGRRIGAGSQLVQSMNLALVVLARTRFSEARYLLQQLQTELENAGRRALLGGCHLGLTACAAAMNDIDAAKTHFHKARELLDETGAVDPDNAWSAETAAGCLWEHDHPIWARALWELALRQWQELGRGADRDRLHQLLRKNFP
jgi:eukaryotic-like serine/threonine-protein kinase